MLPFANALTSFWGHEFSKHATCFSTFNTPCYGPKYQEHEEVVDFFETTIKYYKKVPTFKWLKSADIKPSNHTTYSYSKIASVLKKKHGGLPFIGCSGPRYNATEAGKGSTDNGYVNFSEGKSKSIMNHSVKIELTCIILVWYYDYVHGRPQEVNAEPVDASASYYTNCAKTKGAIHYYERTKGSEKKATVPY
jgi:ribonuclease T2